MATGLCLTVSTLTVGGYWVGHPTCSGVQKRVDESCAGDIPEGDTVNLTAYPDANYFVSNWEVTSSTGTVPPITFSGTGIAPESQTASFIYLAIYGNVEIVISFLPVVCQLTLSVGTSSGKIELIDPSGKVAPIINTSAIVSIDASLGDTTDIVVLATPDPGWSISGWTLDGDAYDSTSQDPGEFTTAGYTERTLIVNFAPSTPCTPEHQLTVSIVGNGSVTSQNKEYCDGEILNILSIPANGWVFDRWDHDGSSGISEPVGNILRVVMNTSRTNITAIFKERAPVEVTSNLFYCSSDTYKDNIIAFDFTNSSNNNDPSVNNWYHFRVNFYTDVDKSKLVYSAFSLSDNKRWFLNDEAFSQLPTDGIDVDLSETVSIVYDPEILSSQITETQKPHLINDETVIYEKPLICGVKYYVEIQAYEVRTNTIIGIRTIPLMLACNRVDSYYWNYNKDKNNWLCSGQGKADLKVCGGFGQAVNSSIDSNAVGTFKIVWQGRKESNASNVYSAVWDSNRDILYSSGQGLYDVLEMDKGNHPIVITDPALNFYITGKTKDNVMYKECGVSPGDGGAGGVGLSSSSIFEAFCYPGESTLLSSSYDEIKMRVYKEDISGSLTISNEKAVSIINKRSIRLDVDGIVGAYAVRVRNMEDPEWSDWINIDSELLNGGTGDDEFKDAYRIDNNRFLVQWDIQNYNGLRRICCQVLTMYGISNIFCIEVLANFNVPQHVFKFYKTSERDTIDDNEFPKYNGQYVLSTASATVVTKDTNDNILSATVYFDAVFSEPLSTIAGITYNLIQQGINDKRNQGFNVGSTVSKLSGDFEIFNSDGIFNKDGASFIEVVFLGDTPSGSCGTDERDKYNFINSDIQEVANIDLLPEEVYQKYQRDRLSKALDINEFKQNYDADDINFKFGNPGYYRK